MQRPPTDFAVPPERLRSRCNPATFTFATTENLAAPNKMVGQERAAEALEFGLSVVDSHYNIFIAGEPGSGRSVSAEYVVKSAARKLPVPSDWCYVHNFDNALAPHALALPAGLARPFARDVAALVDDVRTKARAAFDSDDYRRQSDTALAEVEHDRAKLQEEFEAFAESHGFGVVVGDDGEPEFVPIKPPETEGGEMRVLSRDEFAALTPEERAQMDKNHALVVEAYLTARSKARGLNGRIREIITKLDLAFAREIITPLFSAIRERYSDVTAVAAYLDQMRDDMIANVSRLREEGDGRDRDRDDGADDGGVSVQGMSPPLLRRYRVHVIVDHASDEHAPTISEQNPTYYNLTGRLEYGSRLGTQYTDFTFIKPGALHQANGGFLIIYVKELLSGSPRAWEALKRSLRTGHITIENIGESQLTASPKPEPIPLSVKVVLVGELEHWDALNSNDPDFAELFKVRADFGDDMPRNPLNESFYAQFTGDIAREMKLPQLDRTAVARIVEEGSRWAEDQYKLSTSLTSVRDLVIESGHWAKSDGSPTITSSHVDRALAMRRRRLGAVEEHISEAIRQGTIIIATSGEVVGQVNALSIIEPAGQELAHPFRVTVRTSPGTEGVIAIERETRRSGPGYLKGVYTLAGFLKGQFGQDIPLSLSASIACEQIYSPIDGDSASMAELCAILSALSGVPIRQNLAITGSVNQLGEAQAIGGVSVKIEGFFDACVPRGLDGTHGVIIPEANVHELMLRPDVVEAVRADKFHVYAVKHVDEAVELLMGRPAGKLGPSGHYLSGTVNALVAETLRAYADSVSKYRQGQA